MLNGAEASEKEAASQPPSRLISSFAKVPFVEGFPEDCLVDCLEFAEGER